MITPPLILEVVGLSCAFGVLAVITTFISVAIWANDDIRYPNSNKE